MRNFAKYKAKIILYTLSDKIECRCIQNHSLMNYTDTFHIKVSETKKSHLYY